MADKLIIKAGNLEEFNASCAHININVSDLCNYNCSYCINHDIRRKRNKVLDRDILYNFLIDLEERNYEKIIFAIGGGEPLIYPHIKMLVSTIDSVLSAKTKLITFATNGAFLNKIASTFYKNLRNAKLKFLVSVHMEQIDPTQFIKNLAEFNHPDNIVCKILLAPGKLEEAKYLLHEFNAHDIRSSLSIINKRNGDPFPYNEEEMEFIEKYSASAKKDSFSHIYSNNEIESFNKIKRGLYPEKFNYENMFCSAGLNTLRLGPDGYVARCFGYSGKNHIHNLAKTRLKDIPELKKPCLCPTKKCFCLPFMQTPKWRYEKDKPSYLI